MLNSLLWKIGDYNEQFRPALSHCFAKQFWKPKIVAHKRRDVAVTPAKHSRRRTRFVYIFLSARSERPHLGIPRHQFSFRRENQSLVPRPPILSLHSNSGNQENTELFCRIGEELLCLSAVWLSDRFSLHAEPGRKHLGQSYKRVWPRISGFEQSAHRHEVRALILPHNLKL